MSHAHGGHDSCSLRFRIRLLHSFSPSLARGMTDVGVGSGALLGRFWFCFPDLKPALLRRESDILLTAESLGERRNSIVCTWLERSYEGERVDSNIQHFS